ncbi:hypothetical protein D7B24_000654 [Verticillium nonalfalfae]|uniref:DUF7025 domain-containing protein n=1 Tax=Verticillium nonalfalfae TaxID=1051616 RepID=A0A3M9YH90_9PEZI|nr:uncharacterized protein D7B24_000654 [Verticillium nonalfalfae]RNJ59937.1 hypothetical protein D7B24_000654 [Verticillium nonalfalfae]
MASSRTTIDNGSQAKDKARDKKSRRTWFQRSKPASGEFESRGQVATVQTFYESFDTDNGTTSWVDWAPPSLMAPKKRKFEGAAIQIMQALRDEEEIVAGGDRYYARTIRLQSPYIREALAEDFKKQGLHYGASDRAESQYPHMALFFCRERIAEISKSADDELTRRHCELLCEVVEKQLSSVLDAYDEYERYQTVSFAHVWILFPVDSIFGRQRYGNVRAYQVDQVVLKPEYVTIHHHSIEFDGCRYGIRLSSRQILHFEGKMPASKLTPDTFIDLYKHPEAHEWNSRTSSNKLKRPTAEEIQRNKDIMLGNENYLLIHTPELVIYSLQEGRWGMGVVENIDPIGLDAEVFDKVVYDEKKKDILRALTKSHVEEGANYSDLIAGKVADHLGRPLLRVASVGPPPRVYDSSSDSESLRTLKRKPKGLSSELESKIDRASEWGGLVLFDAFLRHIEYFKGIVFLTTNVNSSINTALQSRVQIHLTFPGLTRAMRAKVWGNFVDRAPDNVRKLDGPEIARLSDWSMSGRDIKNTYNMAIVLCQQREVPVTADAVEDLITLVSPFASREGSSEPTKSIRNGTRPKTSTKELEESLLDL